MTIKLPDVPLFTITPCFNWREILKVDAVRVCDESPRRVVTQPQVVGRWMESPVIGGPPQSPEPVTVSGGTGGSGDCWVTYDNDTSLRYQYVPEGPPQSASPDLRAGVEYFTSLGPNGNIIPGVSVSHSSINRAVVEAMAQSMVRHVDAQMRLPYDNVSVVKELDNLEPEDTRQEGSASSLDELLARIERDKVRDLRRMNRGKRT